MGRVKGIVSVTSGGKQHNQDEEGHTREGDRITPAGMSLSNRENEHRSCVWVWEISHALAQP